ncbi:hypothetical protein PAT3040_00867 [Paenibacillus agaridevorans]|uniref:Uncharacterized protein n=1 Tax=Paenibacillus agaridevorans TaxID=171404 RepID=A0A2R5EIC0_9BACL|nr:hypothetical protein [Paenibacillus agaridevorans]GBG06342.1 hypothetical protein PAT3040_00867 [Paenibacillus agaridevorans]
MVKRTRIVSFVLAVVLIFTTVSSVSAESANCNDCSSDVIYSNEATGNKVVEIEKNGKKYYAAVSGKIVNEHYTEAKLNEMKKNNEINSKNDETIILERVYFQFEETKADAIRTADTPVPVENLDSMSIQAKWSFWKGSWIEKKWDLWFGSGYKVHITSGDASYIIGVGSAVVTGLFGVLGAAAIISSTAAIAVPTIIVVGVLTVYQQIRNEDGSVDFEMFEPNLVNISTCVAAGQYLGQARNKGTFREFFWNVYWPGQCF